MISASVLDLEALQKGLRQCGKVLDVVCYGFSLSRGNEPRPLQELRQDYMLMLDMNVWTPRNIS